MATELSTTPRDEESLEPVLDAIETNAGKRPGCVVADKGYLTERGVAKTRGQWDLVCAAFNLRRLFRLQAAPT